MDTVDTEMVRNMRDEINEQMGNDEYERCYLISELPEIEKRDYKLLIEFLSSGQEVEEFSQGRDFKPKTILNIIRRYSYRLGSIGKLYELFRSGQLKQVPVYFTQYHSVIE